MIDMTLVVLIAVVIIDIQIAVGIYLLRREFRRRTSPRAIRHALHTILRDGMTALKNDPELQRDVADLIQQSGVIIARSAHQYLSGVAGPAARDGQVPGTVKIPVLGRMPLSDALGLVQMLFGKKGAGPGATPPARPFTEL